MNKIRGYLNDGRQHYIVTPNPEIIVKAQKDAEFKSILNKADLAIPDGIGIVWTAKLLNEQMAERVSGTDLVVKIKDQTVNLNINGRPVRIFLLGGRDGVAQRVASQWPEVVGFSEETESTELFVIITEYQPDILFVALGAPKQEKWIAQNLSRLPSVKVAMGVGGAFDFLSQKIKRAPRFMQKIGLEWLWRLAREPRRLSRIFNAVVIFPWMVIKSQIFSYIRKNP